MRLAEADRGQVISVHTLAEREEIPEDLLQKIMQRLSAAGIVKAHRGRRGGFALAKPPAQISVLEVFQTLQGRFAINRCFLGADRCRHQDVCWLRNKLLAIQEEIIGFFRGVTVADLSSAHSSAHAAKADPGLRHTGSTHCSSCP